MASTAGLLIDDQNRQKICGALVAPVGPGQLKYAFVTFYPDVEPDKQKFRLTDSRRESTFLKLIENNFSRDAVYETVGQDRTYRTTRVEQAARDIAAIREMSYNETSEQSVTSVDDVALDRAATEITSWSFIKRQNKQPLDRQRPLSEAMDSLAERYMAQAGAQKGPVRPRPKVDTTMRAHRSETSTASTSARSDYRSDDRSASSVSDRRRRDKSEVSYTSTDISDGRFSDAMESYVGHAMSDAKAQGRLIKPKPGQAIIINRGGDDRSASSAADSRQSSYVLPRRPRNDNGRRP